VVCDTDPFKLHYAWACGAWARASTASRHAELVATGQLFAQHQLGLAAVDAPRPLYLRIPGERLQVNC
jgi:hypothetical protein